MPIVFSADEILETAEQIERNGFSFYTAASKLTKDPDAVKLLADLAEWEVSHIETFQKMRKELDKSEKSTTVFDPEDEMAAYLKQMAGSVAFTAKKNPNDLLGSNPGLEKILTIALEMEKDTVIFYSNIKEMVPAALGIDKIDEIIKEELRHVAIIQKRLAEIA